MNTDLKTAARMALTLWLLASGCAAAWARVDTVQVYSRAMDRPVDNLVVVPNDYDGSRPYPVVYLLHGHGGHERTWLNVRPDLPELARRMEMIVVCPDGKASWYFDSPVDPAVRYETYMTTELPAYVDSAYVTVAGPEGRAVTGLSMGGHGGLWLGLRHPDLFGACGATSGGVDIRPWPLKWNLPDVLGSQEANPQVWEDHSVINQLGGVRRGQAIIFDCGTSDFFLPMNRRLHEEMLYRNIDHEYIERPGAHNGDYWRVSVVPQLMFFDRFFGQSGH